MNGSIDTLNGFRFTLNSRCAMAFWNIEDIASATRDVTKKLGRAGRMLSIGSQVVPSAVLYTVEHGKLWYGDIHLVDDATSLESLGASMEMTLFILPDTTNGNDIDVTDAVAVVGKRGLQILRTSPHGV